MPTKTFKALVVEETAPGTFIRSIRERSIVDLPDGDVLIRVHYSSLNYKDALSASGHRGVTRNYPHTPGIDAAGVVEESSIEYITPGDHVVVNGVNLGTNIPGGFGLYIRVPASWVYKLPENLSLKDSMVYGSAGFTSAFLVYKLITHGVTPDKGKILVTGATGGVGCIAIAILAKIGYNVVAVSGKTHGKQFLFDLGAQEFLHRETFLIDVDKPILKGTWAGVVDTVGGDILSAAIKSTKYDGVVTCCGNVASSELHTTIYPFILRGVSLLGVDAPHCPEDIRLKLWHKLANEWRLDHLERIYSEICLEELDSAIDRILKGQIIGRVVVNLIA
ncbi:MAG: YhdH/YhfP family quinone oxidoreductase [Candidatus Latescibacteria bacterium]|nr:YhdH/YhfP family quinone oxidoreductase [Candidatus Latescibacterota bacterium]